MRDVACSAALAVMPLIQVAERSRVRAGLDQVTGRATSSISMARTPRVSFSGP